MKVMVIRPYPGPGGCVRAVGELVDEHPATASSLIRRGLASEYKPVGPSGRKPVGPSEHKRTGTGDPGRGSLSTSALLNSALPAEQSPDRAPVSAGERQGQAAAGSIPDPAITVKKPRKRKGKKQ